MTRVMVFVDGENLTSRYEAMLKSGRVSKLPDPLYPVNGRVVAHSPGQFAWSPDSARELPVGTMLTRLYYYTTLQGAHEAVDTLSSHIATHGASPLIDGQIWTQAATVRLVPRVFKKESRGTKTKSVDINLCVDVMELVSNNALDLVYLITGDVDYRPLIDAVMRTGKRVYVASLSSGRSTRLPDIPDKFIDLDPVYFQPVDKE